MAEQHAHDLTQAGLLAEHFSEHEAARELRQSVRTVRLWRQQGKGPNWIKIGRKIFYSRTALLSWISGLEHKPVRTGRRPG
jgi:Helix-turn-helix domain